MSSGFVESRTLQYTNWKSPLKLVAEPLSPTVDPDQLLIRVSYIALNPIDIKLKSLALTSKPKYVGKEFSGVIEQVGSNLKIHYSIGERVCGWISKPSQREHLGTHAVLNGRNDVILKTPPSLTEKEAAAFPLALSVALTLLKQAKLDADSSILVLGGGTTVGAYAIQLAKLKYGVKRVVTTCSPRSNEFVENLGADSTIDYKRSDLQEQLVQAAQPEQFQLIVDTVGGKEALKKWEELLKPIYKGSAYVTIVGDAAPGQTYSPSLYYSALHAPGLLGKISFSKMLGLRYKFIHGADKPMQKEVDEFFAHPEVKVPVDSEFDLQKFQLAWDKLNHLDVKGKVLLRVA